MASSPSFFTTTPVLKPLPASVDDFQKEYQSFQNLDPNSDPPPRAKLYHYMISSRKIKRPSNTAMILLVGSSGVGKSSTINHLLDTGEGNPVAMTSATESETRKTSEYVLTIDEPNYEVCDLKMSVVDTPGFNDTAGTNQVACNCVSIKRFFETHPTFPTLTFPNLVFLVVSAMDQRIKGPHSNLSKCLRGIKLLNVIDTSRPNLVVVLTFCCSVPHKDVNKWKKKMEEKEKVISSAVYEVLGIHSPLVLIENEYDEHKLSKDGDYTLLPDGEKQPKNLYDACLKLLEPTEDRFGLMVLNASFQRSKKDLPTNGHEVEAKNSRVETLSDEIEKFSIAFGETAEGDQDPLALRVMEYVREKRLNKSEEEKVMKLVKTMNSLGLSNEERLQNVTIGEINCVHSEEISNHGIEMLKEKLKIKNEIASFNSAQFFGQGYNIITDESVPAQIMTFSATDDTEFGFRIPAHAKIDKVNETRESKIGFQSDESCKTSGLQNLGLNIELEQPLLKIPKIAPQFGLSTSGKNNSGGKSMKTTKSSLVEYRMAMISIPNLESDNISYTSDFYSAVKELPGRYTGTRQLKQKFEKFFNRFGHSVIVSAFVGGAVEVKINSESFEGSNADQQSVDGSASANVPTVFGVEASGKTQPSTERAKSVVLNKTETRWQGGRSDLHNKNTLQSEKKMDLWKASLSKEPALLATKLGLEPISSVVAIIDKTKGKACDQALRDCLHGKDIHPVRNLQDQLVEEEKKRMEEDEQERRRNESNSRILTTKEPDTKGWWENVTRNTYLIGRVLVVVVAGAIATVMLNMI